MDRTSLDQELMPLVRRMHQCLRASVRARGVSAPQLALQTSIHRNMAYKLLRSDLDFVPAASVVERIRIFLQEDMSDKKVCRLIELCEKYQRLKRSRTLKGRVRKVKLPVWTMAHPDVRRGAELFRERLQQEMKRRKVEVLSEFIRMLGVSHATLHAYICEEYEPKVPSPRLLGHVRDRIQTISDEDAQIILEAHTLQTSLAHSKKYISRVRRDLDAHRAAGESSEQRTWSGRHMPPVSEVNSSGGSCFTAQYLDHFQVGDLPYILTPETFRKIKVSKLPPAQLAELLQCTNLALEKARMCFLILAQLSPHAVREDLVRRIGQNADLLWRAYKVASAFVPREYLKALDSIQLEGRCD